MAHPDTEALAGLVLGGDWADDDPQVAEHVASCATCRRTVAELQHALTIAGRAGSLEAPPPGLWDRIESALDGDDADGGSRPTASPATPATTPGTATPGTAAPATTAPPAGGVLVRPHRRRSIAWSAAAAVVGLLAGVGFAWAWNRDQPSPLPTQAATTTVSSVPLDTLDTKQSRGEAALVRSDGGLDLRIDTTSLDPGTGYLEVWLLNRDGKRMVSVGVLGSGGKDTFPIAQSVIDNGFVTVDISREAFDENLQHSGDSLVRGTLGL